MSTAVVASAAEILLDETLRLSMDDLCAVCKISFESVSAMIEEGIVEPSGSEPEDWRFDAIAVRRLQTALRLQRDLGVNLAGAALALDLLEELETLRRRGGFG